MSKPPLPPWMTPDEPDKQREIDEQTAARMGITVDRLHEIDRQVAADMRDREALRSSERIIDGNPKFNKGFGPVTPENTIAPGEIRTHDESSRKREETVGRPGRPSRQQLALNFESMLARALVGRGLRTHTGLDRETRAALEAIALAHPNATDELVEDARRAFAGQLDGSNAAGWHAEKNRMLSEMEARRKPRAT